MYGNRRHSRALGLDQPAPALPALTLDTRWLRGKSPRRSARRPMEDASMPAGRHFLQIPGPTNVPDRVLRAIAAPTIDHRGPEFGRLAREILDGLRPIFGTRGSVVIYPASGTGAWEAALVNTLSPGDRLLMFETGHFAMLWCEMARRLGLEVELIAGDWRHGANPALLE